MFYHRKIEFTENFSHCLNGTLTPIGDISDFEDIATACWFFGTDMSKNITGSELIVDGGMSCQLYPHILNELKSKTEK